MLNCYGAEPNSHKFSDLKRHKFILSVLEVRVRSHFYWAEVKALALPPEAPEDLGRQDLGEHVFHHLHLPATFLGQWPLLPSKAAVQCLGSVGPSPFASP